MALGATPQWKEEMIISDEEGRSFTFDCGWGADPPVAYVPTAEMWPKCVPEWLAARRDEAIEAMRRTGHRVKEAVYPVIRRADAEST